ncbi:MAG: SiaB family protein kinase [Bacteroidales bacterium]|nr:SiaB family protein kinase [Bacteroidales bacterium]MCF8389387.1 SiaB family protein kinase [Bacteroidales bacterium]
MKEFNLIDYYHRLKKDDLTLAYYGSFKDSIVEKIVDLSESYLEKNELGKIKKKAVFLVAECFQNVARHGVDSKKRNSNGKLENAFFIRVQNNFLHIASANPIRNEKIELLSQKIEYLNTLNQEDLSKLYKTVLVEGKYTDKGGASLGLIEMARKTGNKLNFHFEPDSKDFSIFYIMLSFGPPESMITKEKKKIIFDEIIQLDNELFKSDQYLLYKSDFRHETLLPVIQMIENNLKESDFPYTTQRDLFHASVEMIQNISKHGLIRNNKKVGLFSYGRSKETYSVKSVNEISIQDRNYLQNLFELLKNKNEEELKIMFKENLKSKSIKKSDLTFIDLSRIGKTWDFEFSTLDADSCLFDYRIFL